VSVARREYIHSPDDSPTAGNWVVARFEFPLEAGAGHSILVTKKRMANLEGNFGIRVASRLVAVPRHDVGRTLLVRARGRGDTKEPRYGPEQRWWSQEQPWLHCQQPWPSRTELKLSRIKSGLSKLSWGSIGIYPRLIQAVMRTASRSR